MTEDDFALDAHAAEAGSNHIRANRRTHLTARNLAISPLLLIRAPVMLVGMALERLGLALQWVAGIVPGWTRERRR